MSDGEKESPELRAYNSPAPEVPEHLRQKVNWTKRAAKSPNVQVRGVKVVEGKKPETKKKKTHKSKKQKPTRYAYLHHGCPKCKKNIMIQIPELGVIGFVNQIRSGYKPTIPDGMTICKVRIPKLKGEQNENKDGPTGKN